MAARSNRPSRLTVAITGPTGEIGRAVLGALERSRDVARVRGMARRVFDPHAHGWEKLTYQRGDVLDERSVAALVEGADVVIHLAFIILGSASESRRVNLDGSRNVFRAAVKAGAKRLVYASSVAAYGFHSDNPQPLTEDVPARGTDRHYYSAHKAEVERMLTRALARSPTKAYVFRPCIVAGPQAPLLLNSIPYTRLSRQVPRALGRTLAAIPLLKPVLPDPGMRFQLVHHDDVAEAMRAAVVGRGSPGVYNLAGRGELTMKVLARELGWYSVPLPAPAVGATAEIVGRLGFLPAEVQWISAFREPVIMSTSKARRELGWRPKHDALQTLRETIAATRAHA
jgi:nucleoside-diphosphate-sugar epimerase